MKKLLAIGLAAALLTLAAVPAAQADDGRHRSFALGAGAGVVGTVLVESLLGLFGSRSQAPTPAAAPAYAPAYAPPPPAYQYYAPPPVVYYPAPTYYVVPPPPPPPYYYYGHRY